VNNVNSLPSIISRHKKRIAWVALAHASISFVFWSWGGVVALGPGFKDKQIWTIFDQIQATVVPPIVFAITAPGRYFFFDGWLGLLIPWLTNSLLWSVVLVIIYELLRPKHE
jgi:predicted permease